MGNKETQTARERKRDSKKNNFNESGKYSQKHVRKTQELLNKNEKQKNENEK